MKKFGKMFLVSYLVVCLGSMLVGCAAVTTLSATLPQITLTQKKYVGKALPMCESPDCREAVSAKLNIPVGVTNLAADMSTEMGIDPFLVFAVIRVESEGKWWAESHVGAKGLMQVMPIHHNGPSSELFDERLNIYYGIKYLKTCKRLFGRRSHKKSISCYNMGEGNTFKNRINGKYYRDVMRFYQAVRRHADLSV